MDGWVSVCRSVVDRLGLGLTHHVVFIPLTTTTQRNPDSSDEAPACSTRWAKDEGTTVWCEDDGLVPRRLHEEGGRCVCVDPTEAGAHDAGKLEVYPGCEPHAYSCTY